VEAALLRSHSERGLQVVILQPTIVYGPFSAPWTDRPVERLLTKRLALPAGGVCNPVYVDDVVQAMLLARSEGSAVGERFLITGPDCVSWREFYAAFESILGVSRIVEFDPAELEAKTQCSDINSKPRLSLNPRGTVSRLLPCWLKNVVKSVIGEKAWQKIGRALPPGIAVPGKEEFEIYNARSVVRIDKARRLLGYCPEYTFAAGMAKTADYIRWMTVPTDYLPSGNEPGETSMPFGAEALAAVE
jgi:nucleoside-diphosphate-sugar epimerase